MGERKLEIYEEAERSIIKKYRKKIWNNFISAVKEYQLINKGDKIAVCISGGKDSMLLAKCVELLSRYSDVPFEAVYLVMDPGYNCENRELLESYAKKLNININIFKSDIFEVTERVGGSPCYLCARMRRGWLYSKAQELGCNKIALGHHFNDAIETLLMSMMYSSEIKTMLPKLKSTNFKGMELIRPLYKVKEDDIISWANYNGLTFLQCACRFTADSVYNEGMSKRKEIKGLIKEIKHINPAVDDNLFRSMHNVNLATMPGYRDSDSGSVHSFLERYSKPDDNE